MASKPITLTIKSRGKSNGPPRQRFSSSPIFSFPPPTGKRIPKLPSEASIYIQGTGSDLYQRLATEAKFSIHRLRVTKEDGTLIPNNKATTIESLELKDGSVIQVKDLGKDILILPRNNTFRESLTMSLCSSQVRKSPGAPSS